MHPIRLVRHFPGTPDRRLFGLRLDLRPCRGLLKLQRLLDRHTFVPESAASSNCDGCWWERCDREHMAQQTTDGLWTRQFLWLKQRNASTFCVVG